MILTLSFSIVRTEPYTHHVENSISFLTTTLKPTFIDGELGIVPMNATEVELKLWRLIGVNPYQHILQLPLFF